jgi:hypothetical protein
MTFGPISDIEFTLHPTSTPVPATERDRLLAEPGFGTIFTDHMVTVRWSRDAGWHDGRLAPYGPITLDPATSVLHYAQEIFEGLKAFRQVSGQISGWPCQRCPRRRSSGLLTCWSARITPGCQPTIARACTSGRS